MNILEKIKRIPFILGILSVLLIIGIVYAADYYQVNSGVQATINEWSVCKKVTNNNALAIFVPTKTAAEWTAFRTYATGISLAECNYYCDEDNDGHYTTTLVSCPSGRTSPTVGDDCNDSCATCYPGSASYTSSPDGLDQDCANGVDNVTDVVCTASYGGSVNYGYTAATACTWLPVASGGIYRYKSSTLPQPPADVTHCQVSGETCTDYTNGWGNCGVQYDTGQLCISCTGSTSCGGYTWKKSCCWSTCQNCGWYNCTPMTGCTRTARYH